MPKPKQEGDQNQGEGNREADRNYRRGATGFADADEQHRAAREAGREVEEEERDDYGDDDDDEQFDDDEDR
jgi:hypothetical protein